MLDVLDKHKLIGGKGMNTLTYLENTDEDFNEGELKGVYVEDSKIHRIKYEPQVHLKGEVLGDTSLNTYIFTYPNVQIVEDEKFNKVYSLNGTNSYFYSNNFGTLKGDFTIDFWFNLDSTQPCTHPRFFYIGNGSYTLSVEFVNGSNIIRVVRHSSSTHVDINFNTRNEWTHIAFVRKKGEVSIYLNGVYRISFTYDFPLETPFIYVGAQNTTTNLLKYKLFNFRITEGCIWSTNFDPNLFIYLNVGSGYRISPQITTPRNLVSAKCNWEGEGKISTYQYTKKQGIDENTVLYLKGEDFTDSSLYNKPITNVGATINSNGKVNKGIELAKTRVNIDRGMEGVDLSKDFTIDWWEYSTGATTTGSGLILNRTVTNSNYARCFLIGHKGTQLYAGTSSATTSWNIFSGVDVKDKVDNVWVHWAFVKKGTKYTTYKNGVEFWTTTNSSVFGALEGDKLCLGAWINNTNIDMGYNAIIDNFRISNIARWEENFTPPEKDYELDEEIITPLVKGNNIKSLPYPLQLKQEVEGEETISNVSLEMKYKLEDTSTVPKEEGEDNTFYLYNEGDECTDITGGWKNGEFMNLSNTSWLVSAYAIKNTNNLEYGDNNANGTWYGYGGFITNSKVDLTPYSKMFIDWEMYQASVTTYNGGSGSVVNAIAYSDSTSVKVDKGLTQLASIVSKQGAYNTNRVVTEIDISNISGQKHICVNGQAGYINTDLVKNRTYKIWLEK